MVGSSTCSCGARLPYGEKCDCECLVSFTVTTGGDRFLQLHKGNQMWIIDTRTSRCVKVPIFAAKETLKSLQSEAYASRFNRNGHRA